MRQVNRHKNIPEAVAIDFTLVTCAKAASDPKLPQHWKLLSDSRRSFKQFVFVFRHNEPSKSGAGNIFEPGILNLAHPFNFVLRLRPVGHQRLVSISLWKVAA